MDNWLTALSTWLIDLVKSWYGSLVTWVHDGALWIFDGILQAIAGVISAIPVPAFLSSGLDIGSLFGGFPPFALYMMGKLNLGYCFAMFGAAVSFRLLRKLFTLGQW